MSVVGYGYVLPKLAIGSQPPVGEPLRFDVLVLTAKEIVRQPAYQSAASFPGIQMILVPLDDARISAAEVAQAARGARMVARDVRSGKRVLVTCYQGRNRSGLVTAMALMYLGYSDIEAIRRVRDARGPDALSNMYFVDAIHQMETRRAHGRVHV